MLILQFTTKEKPIRPSLALEMGTVISSTLHQLEISLSLKETLAHANDCCSILIYILDEINIKQMNAEEQPLCHSHVLLRCVHRVFAIYMKMLEIYLINEALPFFCRKYNGDWAGRSSIHLWWGFFPPCTDVDVSVFPNCVCARVEISTEDRIRAVVKAHLVMSF